MNEQILKRLREAAGKSQRQLGGETDYTRQYIGMMENEEKPMTFKAAAKLAKPLNVEPNALFVLGNMQALKNRVDAGTTTPYRAVQDLANVLKFMDSNPEIQGDAEQAILGEAKKLADRLMAATKFTGIDRLGRDSMGTKKSKPFDPARKSAARSSFANDFPAASPRGDMGSGRPDTLATVSDPSARSLTDAVASLEDDIANGITEGAGILSRVASIVGNFENVDLSGDKDAQDAYKKLKLLAASAAQEIGGNGAAKKSRSIEDTLGRGAGGRKLVKKYGG